MELIFNVPLPLTALEKAFPFTLTSESVPAGMVTVLFGLIDPAALADPICKVPADPARGEKPL